MPFYPAGGMGMLTVPDRKVRLALFLLFATTAPKVLCGQTSISNQFNPLNSSAQGVYLYGVSIFSGYYSAGVPIGNVPITVSPATEYSYDSSVGLVATFG